MSKSSEAEAKMRRGLMALRLEVDKSIADAMSKLFDEYIEAIGGPSCIAQPDCMRTDCPRHGKIR
jgi:hypothetical protein